MDEETQKSLIEYKPRKDIFDVLDKSVKNATKINLVRTTMGRNNTRFRASLILKETKFELIARAVFNIREKNRYKHKFNRESLIKAIIWKRFCNIKRTTILIQLLLQNKDIAKNLGFEEEIPSSTTMRVFESYFLREDYMKRIIFRIIKEICRESRKL